MEFGLRNLFMVIMVLANSTMVLCLDPLGPCIGIRAGQGAYSLAWAFEGLTFEGQNYWLGSLQQGSGHCVIRSQFLEPWNPSVLEPFSLGTCLLAVVRCASELRTCS